jgi:hypothetical protein
MSDENINHNEELNLDDLDEVSGGYIIEPQAGFPNRERSYVLVAGPDGQGYEAGSKETMIEMAKQYGVDPTIITPDEYEQIYGKKAWWFTPPRRR